MPVAVQLYDVRSPIIGPFAALEGGRLVVRPGPASDSVGGAR